MSNIIDELLGRKPTPGTAAGGAPEEDAARAELAAEDAAPEHYRPYVIRSRPQLGFVLIEKGGTMHGFQYHTIRQLRHEHRGGAEYLSFHADGLAVAMEGRGLGVMFRALVRHTLTEAREYDERPATGEATMIARMGVVDVSAELRAAR